MFPQLFWPASGLHCGVHGGRKGVVPLAPLSCPGSFPVLALYCFRPVHRLRQRGRAQGYRRICLLSSYRAPGDPAPPGPGGGGLKRAPSFYKCGEGTETQAPGRGPRKGSQPKCEEPALPILWNSLPGCETPSVPTCVGPRGTVRFGGPSLGLRVAHSTL